MRILAGVAALMAACSQIEPAPLTVRLEDGLLTVRNDSAKVMGIAAGFEDELAVGLEVFDEEAGDWRWYGEDCRHSMADWQAEALAPGATAASRELPKPDSAGRFRYVTAWHRPGESWQWLPVGEFEERQASGREPHWERGGAGSWPDSSPVKLRIANLQPDRESKHARFQMDLEIENGSGQPISYNVTTNYWWCEEAGRWYRHPGWTRCGNSAHPEIGVGQTMSTAMIGKCWGRLRFGMRFTGLDDDFAARSEPFEVAPYPGGSPRALATPAP